MSEGYYTTAEVCPNGHHTTASAETSPALRSNFCPEWGEATFTNCKDCGGQIRGDYHVPGVVGFWEWSPPNYCHQCGEPYPWTTRRLATAKAMADEIDRLTPQDREILKQSLPELGRDSPRTDLAVTRYSKLREKMGKTAASAFDKVVGALATAAVKTTLGI